MTLITTEEGERILRLTTRGVVLAPLSSDLGPRWWREHGLGTTEIFREAHTYTYAEFLERMNSVPPTMKLATFVPFNS